MNLSTSIENVLLIDGLKHSILSIYQLCDKGLLVSFDSDIFQQAITFSFRPRNDTLNGMACSTLLIHYKLPNAFLFSAYDLFLMLTKGER